MDFIKMHGLGNDFVCLDRFLDPAENNPAETDYSELAQRLCHRQLGIGGDGLLLILPSEKADARMRIFNADGSEPEMCGNGIRCFARYIYEQGYVQKDQLTVETLAGIKPIRLQMKDGRVYGVTVDMGKPRLSAKEIPVNDHSDRVVNKRLEVLGKEIGITAVSVGNPHCVLFLDDFAETDVLAVGAALEKHPFFPAKTNVEFVRVDSGEEITVKVWERGVGPTLACGTGACASVVAAVLNGRTGRRLTVHLPGGDLQIEYAEEGRILMTGPAQYVFRGQLID
ncbi:diaminopimelate epimerase [Syntrophobotulus glycolicus DSM 8271]|uniref:Diaminopimelate epimerase n=1 Tax=Syntrophobotulus glycolicus (strain DSM 8271 / FlGlyR) TaxID=645991 RepID=F0T0I6_SYNGF|nr:diaminopimelate epimerase [Syntrophobotulus glycolicus]ADY55051.1 diaminopimelate epimerase [Syntrophobotulus glycolicus DSM 8271]